MLALNTLTFIFHFTKRFWYIQYCPLPLFPLLSVVSPVMFFLLGEAQVISLFITLTFLWANTQSELWFISYCNVAANCRQGGCILWSTWPVGWPERSVGKSRPRDPVQLEFLLPWKPGVKQGVWCWGEGGHEDATVGLDLVVTAPPTRAFVLDLPRESELPQWQLRDQCPDDEQLGLPRVLG